MLEGGRLNLANDAQDLSVDRAVGEGLPQAAKEHANVFALKSIDHPAKPART